MKDAVEKVSGVTPKEFVIELLGIESSLVEFCLNDDKNTKNKDQITNQSAFILNMIENVVTEL